jgi:two-component system sensor histidine kinase UhpB
MVLKQVSIRAAAELEHRQLEEAIIESRNELEMQVKERTAELQIINEQLRNEIKIRQQKEQSLAIAEEKYRNVADFTYNWETWISPEGAFIYVSPSCKRITGYTVEDFMHSPSLFVQIAHPEDRIMVEEHFVSALKGEVHAGSLEFRIITSEGQERWIGHHCQPVYDANGRFIGQRGSNRDITLRKEAENILLDSQKHLRQLSQRMEAITEAERTRIAREIHDELGHLLTALKYDVEALINQANLSAEDLKSELGIMIDMVDSLIDSVRKIATDLRPGILDHLGLFPAIEWQLKQFRLRTKICCSIILEEGDLTFDKNETTIIFRIMQEILTNITRHSAAKHVKVLLTKKETHFLMQVTDNGVGFKPAGKLHLNSLGLLGMKERALSIGGEIQIDSQPGKGTTVRLLLTRN